MITRRFFFRLGIAAIAGYIVSRCRTARRPPIPVSFKSSPADRGHQVWKHGISFSAERHVQKRVVVVGAGIAGLSAVYHLKKKGITNVLLVELDDRAGGNAVSGGNSYSEYPYGAHYLTMPNPGNIALQAFLHEQGIIVGFDDRGRPLYNETDLCADPEERLYIRGTFQPGLLPHYGIAADDKQQMDRFFDLMQQYAALKGSDGLYFFDIPRSLCSVDRAQDYLDKITFSEFLDQHRFTSQYLLWYLGYCCRDDYGAGSGEVSAWAGINYFAARRAEPGNTDPVRVLTWPEGNGRLVKCFVAQLREHLQTGVLVKRVALEDGRVSLDCIDFKNQTLLRISCDFCVVAVPPFVSARILDPTLPFPFEKARVLQHYPWMVAAVTLADFPEGRGTGLCWDNVAYQARSLGYVNNRHQRLERIAGKQVISLYLPLDDTEPSVARRGLMQKTPDDWRMIVVSELELMHAGIGAQIEHIEICLWGHGMVLPAPGISRSPVLRELSTALHSRIFFAHSDLVAYSNFEEAFDQGVRAAQEIVDQLI